MLATRLGELLVRERMITLAQAEEQVALAKQKNIRFVDALLQAGMVDERNLLAVLSKQYRIPVVDLAEFKIELTLVKLLPAQFWAKHAIIPVGKRGETLVIATSDPTNIQCVDDIRFQTRLRVEQVLAMPSAISYVIENQFGIDTSKLGDVLEVSSSSSEDTNVKGELMDMGAEKISEDDAPIIQFVTAILADSIRKKASDIHIEPYESDLRVRLRIDGDLVEAVKPPPNVRAALTARVKVMAKLRLDEKRLPQDGRIRFKIGEKVVDFRVNTLPTVYGEKVVLRLLDKSNATMTLEQIGFEKDDMLKFAKVIKEPWGIVLVTGATGSGKTTTLYAALNELNTPDVNISTIEDPVEYNFHGINQVQTKEQIGLTFAETLRALLRQDPDIVLLGEIRDVETAQIAFKAALTGHLVLSTLHTNDAPSSVMRLKDMGLETFLINSALHAVVAQKLVRRVCKACKAPDTRFTPEDLLKMGFPQSVVGKFQPVIGKGCATCRNTGYKGRAAIHEVMVYSEFLKDKVAQGATTDELRKLAIQDGMRSLKVNCMRKIIAGIVSIDELQSVGSQS